MHWMEGWPMGWMGFGGLFILLLVGVLVWALVRGFGPGASPSAPPGKSAEDILKERYARGEIERDEYQRRLADIRKG